MLGSHLHQRTRALIRGPPHRHSHHLFSLRSESATTNPNADLISVIFEASSKSLSSLIANVSQVSSQLPSRALRLIEPPPSWLPPGPSGDQAVNLLQSPLAFLDSTRQYGRVCGLLIGTEYIVLISDREAAKAVMINQASSFQKEGTAFFPNSSLAGQGMLVIDGDLWKRQRRLSNPAFRQSAIETYSRAMVSGTDRLLSKWEDGEIRDVYADFNALTLEITLEAIFGLTEEDSSDGKTTRAVVEAVEQVFIYFTARAGGFALPEWIPTPDNIDFSLQVAQLDEVIYRLIRQRRKELASADALAGGGLDGGGRKDLLQALLVATDEETGQGMSDKSLRDELMTMLIAGQETSAILLGWAMALLAHNPDIQELAAKEVAEIPSSSSPYSSLQASDIRRMPYVEAVVLEALRLYPPAYLVGRCAAEDVNLDDGGVEVKQGTTVLISPYLLHRDTSYWGDNSDAFDPTRWRDWQQGPDYRGAMTFMSNCGPNGAFVPFGAGPRNCIGTGFAMMEACLVLASVLRRFKVEAVPGQSFPSPKPLITLRPEEVQVRLTKR